VTLSTKDEFAKLWLCGDSRHHSYVGGCWGNGHLSLDTIKREALRCASTCGCWRHTVIEWALVRTWLRTGRFGSEPPTQLQFQRFNVHVWLEDHIGKITQKSPIQRESENVNRDEIIQARIRDLEAELAQRRVYGRDTHGDGTVLSWAKTHPGNDKMYHYAAIKVDDWWYITGTSHKGPLSWDGLVTKYWTSEDVVAEVFICRSWRVIGREDETVQTAPLASWVGTAEVKTEVRGE
jgi:hypothetical protein